MRFLGKDDPSFHSNALPVRDAPSEIVAGYRKALDRQASAAQAWRDLMELHIKHGSQWSAIVHSALASGMTTEDLRLRLGASPSTLSRWLNGRNQPPKMLRDRLTKELKDFTKSAIDSLRDAARKLPGIGARQTALVPVAGQRLPKMWQEITGAFAPDAEVGKRITVAVLALLALRALRAPSAVQVGEMRESLHYWSEALGKHQRITPEQVVDQIDPQILGAVTKESGLSNEKAVAKELSNALPAFANTIESMREAPVLKRD